jgi:hypothetical protein
MTVNGSKTVLMPSKWDVCFTLRKQTSVSFAAGCDVVVICYGGAKLTDKHLASTTHGSSFATSRSKFP